MIRERFFLGGVSSLRGFKYKGVGPRGERRPHPDKEGTPGTDALGGDAFAALRAAVCLPLASHAWPVYGLQHRT